LQEISRTWLDALVADKDFIGSNLRAIEDIAAKDKTATPRKVKEDKVDDDDADFQETAEDSGDPEFHE
jgi:hypothetical protein